LVPWVEGSSAGRRPSWVDAPGDLGPPLDAHPTLAASANGTPPPVR
jgi:hypothetical protein